jgi:cell division septum initiation protein DivIVA
MMLKTRILILSASLGLAFSGGALTALGIQKPVPPTKTANANPPKKTGQSAEEKGPCHSLNLQAKELLAKEKQLLAEARQKEAEVKALVAQANQIERQRVAEEHSLRKGQNNSAAEAQLKSQEQQRVNLEQQATAKTKEREALIKQANELGKQRLGIEQQHKQNCPPYPHKTRQGWPPGHRSSIELTTFTESQY